LLEADVLWGDGFIITEAEEVGDREADTITDAFDLVTIFI